MTSQLQECSPTFRDGKNPITFLEFSDDGNCLAVASAPDNAPSSSSIHSAGATMGATAVSDPNTTAGGGDADGNGAASHPLISVYVYDRRNTGTLDWMRAGSKLKLKKGLT
jgi:hypothetical protein